ncbi:hypothetical protein BGZ80_001903 [Entomortierella chlamydospora]|uniref:Uncharacterized protein n=1 Tax=Entomortierella chlamydospora TaxID=101097 RepID=A0A9P6MR26_9FUNG|nr:hypothetical protein BGZ80_001903 [Entomortierella chlamydospora]
MFATRPVDPFHEYTKVLYDPRRNSDEMEQYRQKQQQYQHQRPFEQELGSEQPPQSDSPSRKKRPFHFEPEFIAALDASLQEQPILSRSRPTKKPKHTTVPTPAPVPTPTPDVVASATNANIATTTASTRSRSTSPSLQKPSEGVSIIDLSSGEELASFHLGENEHKRRRESIADSNSSSSESIREVFDSNESILEVLEEHEVQVPKDAQHSTFTGANWNINSMDSYRDTSSDQDVWMSDDEESSKSKKSIPRAELGALIRYEGPKTMTLADGVDALIRQHWGNRHGDVPTISKTQGNELVLYRRPPPTFLSSQDTDDDELQSYVRIEELGDDDDIDNINNTDSHINELEARIMDMDID